MKKKLISILAAMAMLSSTMVPVMAEDTITVGGTLLYSQDFEGEVEENILYNINKTLNFVVENQDGNNVLSVPFGTTYGYNQFGPSYKDAVVKMDFKQVGANGANGAHIGLGVRAVRQSGGAYYANSGHYFDIIRYNEETKLYDKTADALRDRLLIATNKGADYSKFVKIDAIAEEASGVLNTEQIFTTDLKNSERNTGSEFLRMQNTICGTTVTSELKTNIGESLTKISTSVTPYAEEGISQLSAHGGSYVVDNIKIMTPVEVSVFAATPDEDAVLLGSETEFKLSADNDILLQSDIARYEYDKTAVSIDVAKGTIAPLKVGTHTVKVYLDDINSDKSLSASFTVEGVKAEAKLEAVVENPNPAFGEGTQIKVYYGGKDVTSEAEISGASYADGVVTPDSTGLCEVSVSYNGQNVIVPVAVNNTDETIGEQETTPVFTEDFEGDAAALKETYSGGQAVISVTSVTNTADNTTDNALLINGGAVSTATFGPADLVDYVLEYDTFCQKASGSSVSFYGATMRSNTKNGGYKVGVTPVAKYNATTHKIDSSMANANARQTMIAYSDNSANAGNWIYAGFSGSSMQGSVSQGTSGKWIHHKNVLSNNTIKTTLRWKTSATVVNTYEADLASLNSIAEKDGFKQGATTLGNHSNTTYFDNIKIYRINSYNDIKVNAANGKITVAGVNANSADGALSGTVALKAYGDVSVSGTSYTEGNGVGYVVATYTDAFGGNKSKVIKTGALASADAEEFTVISDALLYNQNGGELDALEDGMPVFAKATVKRGALEGNGVMMAVCLYDGDTNALMNVYTSSADAVQRVGENIELYTKFLIPEGAENMYARVFLWDSSMKALTEEFFEI